MQFAVRTDQRADALPLLQMLEKLLHVHLHRTMDGTVVAAPLVVLSGECAESADSFIGGARGVC
jgi:hypothetical protein